MQSGFRLCASVLTCLALYGCKGLPTSGPSAEELVVGVSQANPASGVIQIVDVDDQVTRQLLSLRSQKLFSDVFGNVPPDAMRVGTGDVLEVSIWEAVPATLFGVGGTEARGVTAASRGTAFPDQVVGASGTISIPFAGAIPARNRTLQDIESDIVERLKGIEDGLTAGNAVVCVVGIALCDRNCAIQ